MSCSSSRKIELIKRLRYLEPIKRESNDAMIAFARTVDAVNNYHNDPQEAEDAVKRFESEWGHLHPDDPWQRTTAALSALF